MSPAKKATAKARARRAGRPYPNLVDNMAVASASKKKAKKRPANRRNTASERASAKKSSGKTASKSAKKSIKKSSKTSAARRSTRAKAREKDPKGGLTAAGRKAFARRDGSQLKPGVTKKSSDMSPQEMRRKGSWAVRFYGRDKLPPLVDRQGRPTRHALSAHAWGEPVPRTVAAARRIAAKGERLLEKYQRAKAAKPS